MTDILKNINNINDLKKLSIDESISLSEEVRTFIINTVSKTGGHLAANLGVVELTIAILKVFNPPEDKIIWDVSHQSYTYKILTGRKESFSTLRQFKGVSGFSNRSESEYDAFGAGHSGTALSAALGMAVARDLKKTNEHIVAILGDGSAGCGISFEAFNNVSSTTNKIIVILNDNEMSISANVGALSAYLGKLLINPQYNRWKRLLEAVASRMKMGWFRSTYYRIEEATKSLFVKNIIFEEFGLRYIGPIDGHDINALKDALVIARASDCPIILHVSTQKGKGYSFAEEHPEEWHGTAGFDISSGKQISKTKLPTYSGIFGSTLESLAEKDDKIVAITAAMPAGTGLSSFAKRYPDRFFDVGISEEHAVVFAAGLAMEGFRPVFAVYSTFSQRTVDYIIHDICLQNLAVTLCLDRAGIVGDDGPTHHGVFDIALLRPIPGLVIMQPKDEVELADMLFTATRLKRPVVIRYPRGSGPGVTVSGVYRELPFGRAEVLREGEDVQIWAIGNMILIANDVADLLEKNDISAGVINARFIRPLDTKLLDSKSLTANIIITIEDGIITGGFGSAIEEYLYKSGFKGRFIKFGWPDQFIPQGTPNKLMEQFGLTSKAIFERIMNISGVLPKSGKP